MLLNKLIEKISIYIYVEYTGLVVVGKWFIDMIIWLYKNDRIKTVVVNNSA